MNAKRFDFLTQDGAAVPPLAFTWFLLAIISPRSLAADIAVFAIGALVSLRSIINWKRAKWRSLALPALALCWFALSCLWSASPRKLEMLRDTSYVLASGAALFVTLPAWPDALVRRTINWAMAALAGGTIFYAAQYAMDFPLIRWVSHPWVDHFTHTNIPKRSACAIALLLWPALLYASRRLPTRRDAFAFGLVTWLAVGLLVWQLGSRAALIGTVFAALVFALSSWRICIGQAIGFILLPLGPALTVLTAALLPADWQIEGDLSGTTRLGMARIAWQHLKENPLFGIGLDGSRVVDPLIQTHPHNVYLQWILEGGALAALPLLTAVLIVLWRALHRLPPALQPFVWALAASSVTMLSIAYGAWQGWWIGAHLAAVFLLALVARAVETSAHATPADQRP